MVYYLHKETDSLISKEKLKNMINIDGAKKIGFHCFDPSNPVLDYKQRFIYEIKDIPFNDDFEEIFIPFDEGELVHIHSLLKQNAWLTGEYELMDKVKRMFVTLQNLKFKNGNL